MRQDVFNILDDQRSKIDVQGFMKSLHKFIYQIQKYQIQRMSGPPTSINTLSSKVTNKDGLLKVGLNSIKKLIPSKLLSSILNIRIRDQGFMHKISFTVSELSLDKVHIFSCNSSDHLELELIDDKMEASAFIRFPLLKLCEISRVKHMMDVLMVERGKNKEITKPIKNVLQLDMDILYVDGLIGKFVVHSIEIQLIRNTDIVGKMDPYVIIEIQETKFVTAIKNQEGNHTIWSTKYEFQIKNVAQSEIKLAVWDKDNITDDLVGQNKVNMMRSNLLIPLEKTSFYDLHLLFEGKSAGIAKIQYSFEILPFKLGGQHKY